jgi:hypothetical protein
MFLFSGEGDFRSLVEAVQRRGVRVTVVSTIASHPPMIADERRRQADVFVELSTLQPKVGRDPWERLNGASTATSFRAAIEIADACHRTQTTMTRILTIDPLDAAGQMWRRHLKNRIVLLWRPVQSGGPKSANLSQRGRRSLSPRTTRSGCLRLRISPFHPLERRELL